LIISSLDCRLILLSKTVTCELYLQPLQNFYLVKTLLLISVIVLSFCNKADAQSMSLGGGGGSEKDSTQDFKFLPIPYINYDRSLEFQFGALPMAMYTLNKKDTISPQAVSGIVGIWTTNKSWFLIAFSQFYLKEDRWRVALAGGLVSVNFQTYVDLPVNGFIDYNTAADFVYLEAKRRIFKDVYLGLNYTYSSFNTRFEGVPEPKVTYLNGIGVVMTRDTRDNVYYPKSGGETDLDWKTYPHSLNESGGVNKVEISHNHFLPMRDDNDIIGLRAYVGFGLGELPFEQQFLVGQTDIRGYTQGRYRGDAIYSIQGEYRWNLADRFGLVGFFGIATISGSNVSENNGIVLPGIGAGFRYTAFEKNHFNVGMDGAIGKDDWGIYFRIGEAF
jgi:hypothetical protein